MKLNKKYLRSASVLLLASCFVVGCQDEEVLNGGNGAREPLNLQAEINQQYVTRVNDNGFADGDHIGVFVTNYSNGEATALKVTDNHADNVRFTYDHASGTWTGATQLYWKDKVTPIDAYGYYPFDEDLSSVTAYPFTVQRNQRDQVQGETMYGYEASDFLWAKTEGVVPTAAAVSLRHKHIMAGIQVNLVEGTGFLEGEWAEAEKQVLVESTRLGSTISLQSGTVTVDAFSAVSTIIPQGSGNGYRAIVVPQTVAAGSTLFSITIDGQTHKFTRSGAMVYHPSKLHKFTIEVNYSLPTGDYQFNLLDEAVVAWENDAESHNGAAREYITVHVNEGEDIANVIEQMGIDPKEIINLKLTGTFSNDQFGYIRDNMPYLEAINMRDLRTKNQRSFRWEGGWGTPPYDQPEYADDYIPMGAFQKMVFLSYVVWPEHLVGIGDEAFAGTNLRGSIILPEGLKHIGGNVFEAYTATSWGEERERALDLPNTDEPQILAVRVNGTEDYIQIDNLTTDESVKVYGVNWGGGDNVMKFFYNDGGEYWMGDFYWMYYSFEYLDDAELSAFMTLEGNMPLKGDVNGDGTVSIVDATMITNEILQIDNVGFNRERADMNGDGRISIVDATMVTNIILNK